MNNKSCNRLGNTLLRMGYHPMVVDKILKDLDGINGQNVSDVQYKCLEE